MERFIGTIITIALIIYALKWLFRLLWPFIIRHLVKKATKNFNNGQSFGGQGFGGFYTNFGAGAEQEPKEEEGNVTIQQTQKSKKGQSMSDELGGEYVDYEEVK